MNDIHIQQVEHAKYLGIIIDKNLTWSEHVKKVVNKTNSVKGFLHRNLTKCPLPIKSSCYLSLVRPILEYTYNMPVQFTINAMYIKLRQCIDVQLGML